MPNNSYKSIDGFMRPSAKKATTTPPAKKLVATKPEKTVQNTPPKHNSVRDYDDISAEIATLERSELEMSPGAAFKTTAKKRSPFSKIICALLLLIEVVAGGFFVHALLTTSILVDWQKYAVFVAMALVFLFTARKLAKRKAKTTTRVVCCIIAGLLAVAYGIGVFIIYRETGIF